MKFKKKVKKAIKKYHTYEDKVLKERAKKKKKLAGYIALKKKAKKKPLPKLNKEGLMTSLGNPYNVTFAKPENKKKKVRRTITRITKDGRIRKKIVIIYK